MTEEQLEKLSVFGLVIIEFRMGKFVAEETSGMWENGDLASFMETQCKLDQFT